MRRRLGTAAILAVVVVAGAACEGTWSPTAHPSPVRAVHAALLHTGKVLLIAGSGNDPAQFAAGTFKTAIYDPTTDTLRSDITTPYDMFCSGHAFLPDGRLLVAGGTTAYASTEGGGTPYKGEKRVRIFDPVTETYQSAPAMAIGRWYPTVVSRGNGTLVTLAGFDDQGNHSNTFQTFNPATGVWSANQPIGTFPSGIGVYSPTYPSMHLLADGRLFYSGVHALAAGPDTLPYLWNVDTNQITWLENPPAISVNQRDQGASVLLPPAQAQKVMVIGGGQESNSDIALASTAVIDLSQPNPKYNAGPPIDAAKMYVSAVILPDGRVLETGGATGYRMNPTSAFVKSTQILDPKTMTWTKAPDATVGRTYHSGALLLPDGRVLTFGGNPRDGSFEMNLEIYSPGYMTKARPSITSAPTTVTWNAGFAVSTSGPIGSAVLIRPSAVTHSSDSDQRSIDLAISGATATGATLTIPANHNLTPPGWYMLFVRSADGTPSVAKWVKVA
ncbi:MAG: galactose oxidase-like domain-containing protein [Acidimicrobiia bacterium]